MVVKDKMASFSYHNIMEKQKLIFLSKHVILTLVGFLKNECVCPIQNLNENIYLIYSTKYQKPALRLKKNFQFMFTNVAIYAIKRVLYINW